MQAIQTRYIGPSNTKDARVKAWCERGSVTVSYPHELSGAAVHRAAVDALIAKFVTDDAARYGCEKNPWQSDYVTGALPGGDYCHVFVDDSKRKVNG
jgi:hypothetical protein